MSALIKAILLLQLQEFNYNHWLDVSVVKPDVYVRDWGITLMELHKDITPGDTETSRAMEEVQLRLLDKTRYIRVFFYNI